MLLKSVLCQPLRAFGPIDQDLNATANRLLPYYPMPRDVPKAMQQNASREPPAEHDWSILFFALADHAAMAFRVKPTIEPDFTFKFDSKPFFDGFIDAVYSASVVTPAFTGPSLPDKHEKLDNRQVILEIRSWAARQIAKSGDSLSNVAEKDVIPRADMIQTTGENPVPTNSVPSRDFILQAQPRSRDLFDYLHGHHNMEAEIVKVDREFSNANVRSADAVLTQCGRK